MLMLLWGVNGGQLPVLGKINDACILKEMFWEWVMFNRICCNCLKKGFMIMIEWQVRSCVCLARFFYCSIHPAPVSIDPYFPQAFLTSHLVLCLLLTTCHSSVQASSQWYHPEYVLLLQRTIQTHRHTCYTAYRTAQKLALLQDALAGETANACATKLVLQIAQHQLIAS